MLDCGFEQHAKFTILICGLHHNYYIWAVMAACLQQECCSHPAQPQHHAQHRDNAGKANQIGAACPEPTIFSTSYSELAMHWPLFRQHAADV